MLHVHARVDEPRVLAELVARPAPLDHRRVEVAVRVRRVEARVVARRVAQESVALRVIARVARVVVQLKLPARAHLLRVGHVHARRRGGEVVLDVLVVEQALDRRRVGRVVRRVRLLEGIAGAAVEAAVEVHRKRPARRGKAPAEDEPEARVVAQVVGVVVVGGLAERGAAGVARQAADEAVGAVELQAHAGRHDERVAGGEIDLRAPVEAVVVVARIGVVGLAVAQARARPGGVGAVRVDEALVARAVEEVGPAQARLLPDARRVVEPERAGGGEPVLPGRKEVADVATATTAPAEGEGPAAAAAHGHHDGALAAATATAAHAHPTATAARGGREGPEDVVDGEVLLADVVEQAEHGEPVDPLEGVEGGAAEKAVVGPVAAVDAPELPVAVVRLRHEVHRLLPVAVVEAGQARLVALPVGDLDALDGFGGQVAEGRCGVVAEKLLAVYRHAADGFALRLDLSVLDRDAGHLAHEVFGGGIAVHREGVGAVFERVAAHLHAHLLRFHEQLVEAERVFPHHQRPHVDPCRRHRHRLGDEPVADKAGPEAVRARRRHGHAEAAGGVGDGAEALRRVAHGRQDDVHAGHRRAVVGAVEDGAGDARRTRGRLGVGGGEQQQAAKQRECDQMRSHGRGRGRVPNAPVRASGSVGFSEGEDAAGAVTVVSRNSAFAAGRTHFADPAEAPTRTAAGSPVERAA